MSNLKVRGYLSSRLVLVTLTQLFSLITAASIPTAIPTSSLITAASIPTEIPSSLKNVCSVNVKDENLNLKCSSLPNEFALTQVFANLSLHLDNFITYSLQNATLHSLVVANSTLNSFKTAFDIAPVRTLHCLSLENITFNQKPRWEDFFLLPNIREFSVYNTTLPTSIDSTFGENLGPALQSLTITESNITDIKAESFRDLKILRYLRISHNKLKSFPKLLLAKELEEIRLDYNCIHSLEDGVFNDLPNLKVLSLSSNSISSLPENVFSSIWNSTVHIELRDNPIKCDCRLLWTITSPSKPKDLIGQCASPKRLFGKNLKNLTSEDLAC